MLGILEHDHGCMPQGSLWNHRGGGQRSGHVTKCEVLFSLDVVSLVLLNSILMILLFYVGLNLPRF